MVAYTCRAFAAMVLLRLERLRLECRIENCSSGLFCFNLDFKAWERASFDFERLMPIRQRLEQAEESGKVRLSYAARL